MFLQADVIVKAVMIGLAVASVVTWTVLIAKAWEFSKVGQQLRQARDLVLKCSHLHDTLDAGVLQGVPKRLIDAAQLELELSKDAAHTHGLLDRVGLRLERLELGYLRELRKGIGVLATIGATAPFVGLFGTVWGIMNSFVGIAESSTTNFAVVAPGIAEALLATALGLVAAIPAVVIYNHFTRTINNLRGVLGDLSAGISQLVSRDLDRRP